MFMLRSTKARALVGGVMLLAVAVQAQNAFSPGGNDYPIAGELPGDQSAPRAAVNLAGGYLVWQDNNVDGDGLGIRAERLDGNFNKTGPQFRVNSIGAFDQEKPQVGILTNGGAVFVWQGGKQGFQKIYARFLAATGTNFAGADIRVNTYTNRFQIDPAVAVLKDGSVVVVWSSYGQDGSMQGVYGRRFTSAGVTNGAEFQINQNPLNNQRSPSVAALAGGGFVVTWISELQRNQTRGVDVYARQFTAAGVAVGGEFPVNSDADRVCANPVVVGMPDGGFAVAWSQRDGVVGNNNSSQFTVSSGATYKTQNSWDVHARTYSAAGAANGASFRLNSFTYGDQYAPKLATFNGSYLAVWQSLGQDGSMEGVYGQFFTGLGQLAGTEFQVNSDASNRQVQPAVASDGSKRFLVSWSSFGTGGTFDLFARSYELIQVAITPVGGGLRVSWNTMPGGRYQLQNSSDYVNWTNHGAARMAAGYTDSLDVNPGSGVVLYRVVRVP
jgi:hypothetical protein